MMVGVGTCVYCERAPEEIVELGLAPTVEDALEFVQVGSRKIHICPECRLHFTQELADDLGAVFSEPVEFPRGVTAVQHCCPQLLFEGKSHQEATLTIEMPFDGVWNVGSCPHCAVEVRSRPAHEQK